MVVGLVLVFAVCAIAEEKAAEKKGGITIGVGGVTVKTESKAGPANDKEKDAAPEEPAEPDPREIATHKQVGVIKVGPKDGPLSINTFCIDASDRILAACGGPTRKYIRTETGSKVETINQASQVMVFDLDGKLLTTLPLDFKPQAINVDAQGNIFTAGMGRMAKFDKDGKRLLTGATPVGGNMEEIIEEQKKLLREQLQRYKKQMQQQIEAVEKRIADRAAAEKKKEEKKEKAKKKEEDADKEDKHGETKKTDLLQLFGQFAGPPQQQDSAARDKVQLEMFRQQLKMLDEREKNIDQQAEYMAQRKLAVTGLAVTERDVFVACPAVKGYGYDVYRMNHDFKEPKKIVSGLRGCCGQLDIQAYDGELYAAENSRGRVVRYSRDGEKIAMFGKKDRTSVVGFGSCCNPMNLRFGPGGEVYTAEASLGRIKRFSPDGEFLGLIGTADIIPGCKHVAIAVSKDANRVYMLDITRSQINILQRQPATAPADASRPDEDKKTAAKNAAADAVR